jgi:arginyl-tRNA synthetase
MDKQKLKKAIEKAVRDAQKKKELPFFDLPEIIIEFSEREEHGDYASNTALLIANKIGKKPKEIAEALKKYLKADEFIEKVEIVDPGFINFWLAKKTLLAGLKRVLEDKQNYGSDNQKGRAVIDYSAPNIAKPFGIGHLRSTIIGQAIYNIYKFLGWQCIGNNHLGDWGTQFGKLIVAIKKWSKAEAKELSVQELEGLYVKFHEEAEKAPSLLQEARRWHQKLEKGENEAKNIWKSCVEKSMQEFERIYKILGIKIDYVLGESFYEDKMEAIIKDAREKGIARESRGALVIFVPGFETPLMLLKSDGATTYQTRELATIKYRMEKWSPDLIIYEVGADQKEHLAKSFIAAEMLGYAKKEQLIHMAHGLIRWLHGKFSTRKGDTIHLEDILQESVQRAENLIEKTKTEKALSKAEKKEIASIVGIGAIKYNDLMRHHSKDIVFDWQHIFNLQGNSGPYIQYTVIRCQSILEKSSEKAKILETLRLEPEEKALLRLIWRFPEVVREAGEKFSPNLICAFAFELSQLYNLFYEKYPVLKADTKELQQFRLAITQAVAQTLKNSLNLLGISVPLRM